MRRRLAGRSPRVLLGALALAGAITLAACGDDDSSDEGGGDTKLLAVPIDKLSSLYRDVKSPRDLPHITTQQIAHFFEHYKDLEPGKWVRVASWVEAEEAKREITEGVVRFRKTKRRVKA